MTNAEVDRSEEVIEPGSDPKQDMLDLIANGDPWVFVVAGVAPDGGLALKVNAGGGISDVETIRNLLVKTLNALEA